MTKHIPRFFYPNTISHELAIQLIPEDIHHLKTVLRYKDGATVRIFNEHSGEWNAIYRCIQNICIITDRICAPKYYKSKLILLFSPIKWKSMRSLIMQSTEIGVDILQPVITKNTNQPFNKEKIKAVIKESTEQSNRLSPPILKNEIHFSDIENLYNEHEILICNESLADDIENKHNYKSIIKESNNPVILIGPEGGFSQEELRKSTSFSHICLGPNILRSETACIKALTILQTLNPNFDDR